MTGGCDYRMLAGLIVLATVGLDCRFSAAANWTIVTSPELAKDAAIQSAIEDLRTDGNAIGISIKSATQIPEQFDGLIVVGDPGRNASTAALLERKTVRLQGVDDPQGFEIRTVPHAGSRLMVIAGGSIRGDVYGLYWLWDRMRVLKSIPDLDLIRTPRLPIRLTSATDARGLRIALRHTATWVTGGSILDLVPWKAEPEATRNRTNRAQLKALIKAAHVMRLKFLAVGDEITYHPSLLEEFGATPDPGDPNLWKALQEKHRRLLRALPELDGVSIRTGELTRTSGSYKPFDVMHEPAESDWSLEKRYRTFVKKMHQVIVDEFDKVYFHRTWATNTWEQHSVPEVFIRTFTPDVPTRNLYLSPYMSLADRWYYQPFNPTFNLTRHKMVVLLSTLDYHAHGVGVPVCPSFPGAYHQGGLQGVLSAGTSNLVGVHFGVPAVLGWDTASLTAYTVFRLAWNPDADIRQIAEDFAAIHLGRKAAVTMAEILVLSQQAYKDGIYVKPVAESIRGNTLPHLRLTVFTLQGIPQIDKGRNHIEWLETKIYEPSRGRIDEALEHLDRGLDAAIRMEELYADVRSDIEDPKLARQVGDGLQLTRLLVETNNRYIRTCYAYFRYRAQRDEEGREGLVSSLAALTDARKRFVEAPGFCYQLYGVDQLIESAKDVVADLDKAERTLARAPDRGQVERLLVSQQDEHARILQSHAKSAVKVVHWRGKVDGRDILRIRGSRIDVEHIQGDRIDAVDYAFTNPLPERCVTVLVKDIESRDSQPFLLEQPCRDNDYTIGIYLKDGIPSYTWWEFELYYVDATPEGLGMKAAE